MNKRDSRILGRYLAAALLLGTACGSVYPQPDVCAGNSFLDRDSCYSAFEAVLSGVRDKILDFRKTRPDVPYPRIVLAPHVSRAFPRPEYPEFTSTLDTLWLERTAERGWIVGVCEGATITCTPQEATYYLVLEEPDVIDSQRVNIGVYFRELLDPKGSRDLEGRSNGRTGVFSLEKVDGTWVIRDYREHLITG
jgi:hypothetical protein